MMMLNTCETVFFFFVVVVVVVVLLVGCVGIICRQGLVPPPRLSLLLIGCVMVMLTVKL